MNRIMLFLLLLPALSATAQLRPDDTANVSLAAYTPTQYVQYRGTCFAYAATYTALSIEYNFAHKITDNELVNANAFSETLTASLVRRDKSFFKKLFTLWSCNIGGNVTEAAEVLKKYGAVRARLFPQYCTTNLKDWVPKAAGYKTDGYLDVIKVNSNQTPDQKIAAIKKAIHAHHPVVCAVNQTATLMNEHDYYVIVPDQTDNGLDKTKSNHALCVIGYSDQINKGSFLVKNNYQNFGMQGKAWIRYNDFLKYLCYAIQLRPGLAATAP